MFGFGNKIFGHHIRLLPITFVTLHVRRDSLLTGQEMNEVKCATVQWTGNFAVDDILVVTQSSSRAQRKPKGICHCIPLGQNANETARTYF